MLFSKNITKTKQMIAQERRNTAEMTPKYNFEWNFSKEVSSNHFSQISYRISIFLVAQRKSAPFPNLNKLLMLRISEQTILSQALIKALQENQYSLLKLAHLQAVRFLKLGYTSC